ncbi:hypothetical protein DFQ59_105124 [Thioalbus denitrificans]|uniref:Uncharacterized protein n=2 Tax=Thioalbus denitrificans TaxID=547122 RepID=A0A369C8E7_9GAMM|nr:hypothetical protein DFQ59_105124 [Thioalbus denitrificans]
MRRLDASLGILLLMLVIGIGPALAQEETPLPDTGFLPPGLSSADLEPAESGSSDSAGFGSPFQSSPERNGRDLLRPDPAYRLGGDASSFSLGLDLKKERKDEGGAESGNPAGSGGTWFGMGYEARRQQGGISGGGGASIGLDSVSGAGGGAVGGAVGGAKGAARGR